MTTLTATKFSTPDGADAALAKLEELQSQRLIQVVDAAVASMTLLNAGASQAAVQAGVRAATDVTGFGLLGHLHRMLTASQAAATIDAAAVPLLPGAAELAAAGFVSGGTRANTARMSPVTSIDA